MSDIEGDIMAQDIFAEKIGRLTLKRLTGDRRSSGDFVYCINQSTRASKKYNPLRNTEFIIRPIARNTFRILIDSERFEEAYTAEEAPICLERAFNHECIRAGINAASPRFSSANEEAMPAPRRR